MRTLFTLTIAFFLMSGCELETEQSSLFVPVKNSGVDFSNDLTDTPEMNIIEYLYYYNGAGVAAGDINNDGLCDLYFVSNQGENTLYMNEGEFRFSDITKRAGLAGSGNWNTGVSMADVNGDGLLDIYLCVVAGYKSFEGRNQLYINNGDLTFREAAKEYGLDFSGFSTHAAWFDYDTDGDLDMFLLNHSVHSPRSYGSSALRYEYDSLAGDRLYQNQLSQGKIGFLDISSSAGILQSQIGYGLGVGISDVDQNGFPDIYISNDFHENDYLYLNSGDGTFTESLEKMIGHTSRFSMGNDIADINNDGLTDIITLDMLPEDELILKSSESIDRWEVSEIRMNYGYAPQFPRNQLQLNRGNGHFSEIGFMAGMEGTDWSWSSLIVDLDNDRRKDIFITNGIYRRPNDSDYINYTSSAEVQRALSQGSDPTSSGLIEKMPSVALRNFLFRNDGDLTFTKNPAGWGVEDKLFSNGAAYADLDNDGDYDLILNNLNAEASIYENTTNSPSLSISIKGPDQNPFGIGTQIQVFSGQEKSIYEVYPSRGFISSVDTRIIVGLDADPIDLIKVVWPDGMVSELEHDPTHTTAEVSYTSAEPPSPVTEEPKPLFEEPNALQFRHLENQYNDYEREPLIPRKFSTEGPGLATADINGDGYEDIFIGGAMDQPGQLLISDGNALYTTAQKVLIQDRFSEDTYAHFFDADGDDDADLFVGSGGYELLPGDYNLMDRLYLNDGKGNFERKQLPRYFLNTSVAKSSDIDGDGDLDLFIGSISSTGQYGSDTQHLLLKNDGNGSFSDPVFIEGPAVSDAQWSDLNKDGFPELIVVGEWSPVVSYPNHGGTIDFEQPVELIPASGWYYSITEFDMENDGLPDFIIGNSGKNNPLHPSAEEPVRLYLNDFDSNGQIEPIITYSRGESEFLLATRDELTAQLVSLKRKFPSSSSYAGKTLEEIFPKEQIKSSTIKEATDFSHFILHNTGNGSFQKLEMPKSTQISCLRDVEVVDINNDGFSDLILAYNFYGNRPFFGQYDAGLGDVLINKNGESFELLDPSVTRLNLSGDIRRIDLIALESGIGLVIATNNDSLRIQKLNILK